ncbi:MAG: thiamine diphosphokinase [Chloroflexi bacterium]|nr:thiamine diphosphokinase [Chloroflexota bacterium]
MELCVRGAVERGADPIRIFGALGGLRPDHTLANLALLALPQLRGVDVTLEHAGGSIRLVDAGRSPATAAFDGAPGDLLSLQPLGEGAEGITTQGLRYPLDDEPLAYGPSRGLSNEFVEPRASLDVGRGRLLVTHTRLAALGAVLALLALVACGPGASVPPSPTTLPSAVTSPSNPPDPTELVLMTHDSFALSDASIAAFESDQGVTLRILRSGDAGSMVNQAILSREHPLGDVLYGVDTTFLSRALDAELFTPYAATALDQITVPVDPRRRVTPVDYGDVCLNLDPEAFRDGSPRAPDSLDDLTDPAYRGMLVVENPATSSPGLSFLLATVQRFGDEGATTWRDYWAALRDNDVLVTDGWEDAYYGRFSGGSGEGDRPIVVSYASSPAAEVAFAPDPKPEKAPTTVVEDGCFRQVEYAGILAGTEVPGIAGAFIDHLLSLPVQSEEVPLQMFVYPVRGDATLPDVISRFGPPAAAPIELPYQVIGADRERWISEWTEIVLQ